MPDDSEPVAGSMFVAVFLAFVFAAFTSAAKTVTASSVLSDTTRLTSKVFGMTASRIVLSSKPVESRSVT